MNRTQLKILLIAGLILGIGGYITYRKNVTSWGGGPTMGQKVFEAFPLNDVASVRIRKDSQELNIAKKDDLWIVNEKHQYPASFSEVSDFLTKFWSLKATEVMELGPTQLGRLSLLPPGSTNTPAGGTGTLIEFKNKNSELISSVLLGKEHSAPSHRPTGGGGGFSEARYMMVGDKVGRVLLVKELFHSAEPDASRWIDKTFFRVEKIKQLGVTSPSGASKSWKLTRESETDEWKLDGIKKGEQVDASKLSEPVNALSAPSFEDIVPPSEKPEDHGLKTPTKVVAETFDGLIYHLHIGEKKNEDQHFVKMTIEGALPSERVVPKDEKPEEKESRDKEFKQRKEELEKRLAWEKRLEGWTYRVPRYVFTSLLKERKEFLKQPEPKSASKK
jgi:hypothetical protein